MAREIPERDKHKKLKTFLLVLLFLFSGASIVFSSVILFTDFIPKKQLSSEQTHGIFTAFIEKYIDETHPQKLPPGRHWTVKSIEFPNKNFAIVEATDGQIRTRLEVIYNIEYPNIRVLKVNDITNQDIQDAQLALIRFLGFLKDQDFTNAATLYGGSISRLVPYGPNNAPLPSLLEGYCKRTSPVGVCLPFTVTEPKRDLVVDAYQFTIEYRLPDNSTLKLPNGKSEFHSFVENSNSDVYVVTTLPFD